MKKIILSLILTLGVMTFCNAQKIEVDKVLGGYKYSQNGKRMTMNQLVKTMEYNPEALSLIKKARSNNIIATILGGVGGFLVGLPIGTAISGKKANWTLAGIGAGIIVVSIPISSSANKKTKKAVELYNASLNSSSFYDLKPEFKIIGNVNGIGLSINF